MPKEQFGHDPYQEDVGFRYNFNVNYPQWEGWETKGLIQGFTSLPLEYGVADEVLTRWGVVGIKHHPLGVGWGPPAHRSEYQHVRISPKGYAWITKQAEVKPIDVDDPATLHYRAVVESQETTGKHDHSWGLEFSVPDSRYEGEGTVPNRAFMQAVSGVNILALGVDVLGAGDVGDRQYQVLLQENPEGQPRAIVQSYHMFENLGGYQISPRYLSVDEAGDWQETGVTYPYASQTISPLGPCRGSSTCYNIAKPFGFRVIHPLPGTKGIGGDPVLPFMLTYPLDE